MLDNILLTGANGTLGRAILNKFRDFKVIPSTREDLDLKDLDDILPFLLKKRPGVILHTAAMTNVDECEMDPEKAYLVNWLSTKLLAQGARILNIPMVYISTDYVFKGDKEVYMEWDRPSPLSIYGRSKYFGEMEVMSLVPEFYIVRTSWVFGPGGRNFFSRIKENMDIKEIKAVNDQRSAPTYAPFLASALSQFFKDPPAPGIYHLQGEESASPLEFILEAKEILGVSIRVKATSVKDLKRSALRPQSSVLVNYALKKSKNISVPGWRKGLREFLKED